MGTNFIGHTSDFNVEIEQKRPFRVGDEYRTNPLSLISGGFSIEIEFQDGRILVYDKIKYPNAYIRAVWRNSRYANNRISDYKMLLSAVKKAFKSFSVDGKIVWSAERDKILPWETEGVSKCRVRKSYRDYDSKYDRNSNLDVYEINKNAFDWEYYNPHLDMDQQSAEFWG